MAPMQPIECCHCGQLIKPCQCRCWHGTHWQDAHAPAGLGNLHCSGEPHQRHEPRGGNG